MPVEQELEANAKRLRAVGGRGLVGVDYALVDELDVEMAV